MEHKTEYKNYSVKNGYFMATSEENECSILICDKCHRPVGYTDDTPNTIHLEKYISFAGGYDAKTRKYSGWIRCFKCKNEITAIIDVQES